MIFLIIYLLSIPSCYILTKISNKCVCGQTEWTIGDRNCLIVVSFIPYFSTLVVFLAVTGIIVCKISNCGMFSNDKKANW
jgi:hypothetical protein